MDLNTHTQPNPEFVRVNAAPDGDSTEAYTLFVSQKLHMHWVSCSWELTRNLHGSLNVGGDETELVYCERHNSVCTDFGVCRSNAGTASYLLLETCVYRPA